MILRDRAIRATIVTNSVPVVDLFARGDAPNMEGISSGGLFRWLTGSLVGPHAVRPISAHFADRAFLSAKSITKEGFLTDPDGLEAEVKRTMTKQADSAILLVDGSKFSHRGLNAIAHVSELDLVLAADGERRISPRWPSRASRSDGSPRRRRVGLLVAQRRVM